MLIRRLLAGGSPRELEGGRSSAVKRRAHAIAPGASESAGGSPPRRRIGVYNWNGCRRLLLSPRPYQRLHAALMLRRDYEIYCDQCFRGMLSAAGARYQRRADRTRPERDAFACFGRRGILNNLNIFANRSILFGCSVIALPPLNCSIEFKLCRNAAIAVRSGSRCVADKNRRARLFGRRIAGAANAVECFSCSDATHS